MRNVIRSLYGRRRRHRCAHYVRMTDDEIVGTRSPACGGGRVPLSLARIVHVATCSRMVARDDAAFSIFSPLVFASLSRTPRPDSAVF